MGAVHRNAVEVLGLYPPTPMARRSSITRPSTRSSPDGPMTACGSRIFEPVHILDNADWCHHLCARSSYADSPLRIRSLSMPPVIAAGLAYLASWFQSRHVLQMEILALRHQLAIYQHSVKRPHIGVYAPSVQKLSLTYYTHNHALVRLPRSALRV